MKSFGSVFAANKAFGPGFDFARVALALSIVVYHSVRVTGGYDDFMASPLWIVRSSLVPMFFALSGFLITGSALRLSLRDFLINRGLRIVPALAIEVFLSAVLIGLIFSTVAPADYFGSREFASYFLNIVGIIQYTLPGVFKDNVYPAIVNGSLWTIPYEYFCYALMSLLMLFGLLKRPRLLLVLTAAAFIVPLLYQHFLASEFRLPRVLFLLMFDRGAGSAQCFVLGILFYIYRDRIPFSGLLAGAAVATLVAVALIFDENFSGNAWLSLLICLPLTYVVLFVGFCRIPKIPFYSGGDYSYGIYLYAYPLQQAIVAAGPQNQSWWVNALIAVPVSTAVAWVSWHNLEKPILLLRKKFSFVGRRLAEEKAAPAAALQQDETLPVRR